MPALAHDVIGKPQPRQRSFLLSLQLHPAAILAQRPPTTLMSACSREKPIILRCSSMPQDPAQLKLLDRVRSPFEVWVDT